MLRSLGIVDDGAKEIRQKVKQQKRNNTASSEKGAGGDGKRAAKKLTFFASEK